MKNSFTLLMISNDKKTVVNCPLSNEAFEQFKELAMVDLSKQLNHMESNIQSDSEDIKQYINVLNELDDTIDTGFGDPATQYRLVETENAEPIRGTNIDSNIDDLSGSSI